MDNGRRANGIGTDAVGHANTGVGEKGGRRNVGTIVTACLVAVFLAVACVAVVLYVRGMHHTASFSYAAVEDGNPLIGYAPRAESKSKCADEQLVYIDVTWAEWEPEEGVFDIEGLEKRNNVALWKAQGKHAVLRFVCDMPGDEAHRDIPDWLYQKTADGVDYDTEYGKGYAPVYENRAFISAHARALAALGAWASRDSFVAYVELGSLGHWGEWHTKYNAGVPAMPDEQTCRSYVSQYVTSFPNARLLMRRNYAVGVEQGLGVYNDMTGMADDTLEWLAWQSDGGSYEALGHVLRYEPVDAIWNRAPVGGEFTSSLDMDYMLVENLEETLELVRASHMTFIGPKSPAVSALEESGQSDQASAAMAEGARAVEALLGYQLWVSRLDMTFNPLTRCWDVTMDWQNSGAAPLYFDWHVILEVRDAAGELAYKTLLSVPFNELVPGQTARVTTSIPFENRYWDGFTLGVGITDPLTGDYAVRLAMDAPYEDGFNVLYVGEGRA